MLKNGLGREIIGGLVVVARISGFVRPSNHSQAPKTSRLKRYPATVRGELGGLERRVGRVEGMLKSTLNSEVRHLFYSPVAAS
jgi:hypothetical protein